MIYFAKKKRLGIFWALPLVLHFSPEQSPDSQKRELSLFSRVVVMGASVSDGFQNQTPLGKLFDAAIRVPHEPVESMASSAFFITPLPEGSRQLALAAKRNPTLLLGVDFLFWYGYGYTQANVIRSGKPGARPEESEEQIRQRLERLEKALTALDAFACPLVLGDFPDMWGADPNMIAPQMIPGVKALELLNSRLYEWAKTRPRVLLLPLASWVIETKEGKARLPGREKGAPIPAAALLQEDRLHPSAAGAVVLMGRVVEAIRKWIDEPAKDALRYDVAKVLEDEGLELESKAQ